MKQTFEAVLGVAGLLLVIFLVGYCKAWEYDECLAVGHSDLYCKAQVAGCFGSGSRR